MILETLLPALALAAAQPAQPPADPAPAAPTTRPHHAKDDPLEGFNRAMFGLFQTLDKAIVRPAALGYRHIVPKPLRDGLRNAFSNLDEPIVFMNDLLQLHPGRAVHTLGRFAINSTIGIAGLVDVAKHEKLPHRPNGLGDTLGFYGVGPGPYIFLPVLGPSSLRDLAGSTADGMVLPAVVGSPFDRLDFRIGRAIVTGLDARAESDAELTTLFETALDPYATLRSVYLQNRAAEIAALKTKNGEAPALELDDPLTDPGATGAPADAASAPVPTPADTVPATLDPLADPATPPPTPPPRG